MFYKSYTKSEARAFDHLYDPIYTTGNYRDIQRENAIALTNTAPVNIYTNFESMFSELPQRPRTYNVLQQNQLPTRAPEINGKVSYQNKQNHDTSGQNRAKFFAIPRRNSVQTNKNASFPLVECVDENTKQSKAGGMKPQLKSRSISCQTIYREQSAQTKPYLPQIQYQHGIEKTELFQFNTVFDIDTPFDLSEIIAINRRRKRLECEKLLKQCNDKLADQKQQIFESLEWEEWLTHENDIEHKQSLRFRTVEEKLKQRDKLFENDSIKTIDLSINRLNNEHKRQMEAINKKYERSMRKLRKSVYYCKKSVGDKHSNVCNAIQKIRHGNLNHLIATGYAVQRYETALERIEKVDSCLTLNYEQSMHTDSRIDKPKNVICEIMPGFLKDNNLRIVYEALKAYRLQQTIHNEIANKLKSIDKFRVTTASHHGKMAWKITDYKNKIAEMLKLLAYLKELLQNIPHISIDSFLDLLTHKFHVIETESSVNDLLNLEYQKRVPSTHFDASYTNEPSLTDVISTAYLNDILRRCSELKSKEKPNETENANSMRNEIHIGMNDVMRDVWPDIMDRLENYLDHRKQIKVDLKRLTSEEEAMVESIRDDCVESIIEDLFYPK